VFKLRGIKMVYFRYPDDHDYFSCLKNFYNSKNNNKNYRDEDAVKLQEQKLKPTEFAISYPVIPPSEDKGDDIIKVNNAITNEVSELFKSQVLKPEVLNFNEVLGIYETMLNKKGILSILFSMYTYVNKSAHGFTQYSSITANVKNGQIYSFSDLFNSKVYYVGFLNEIVKQYIKENNFQLINEYHGITENQSYYLTPNSLVIYYQVYEYTPYYYGLFKIEIPYNKISNIISPVGPIAKLI
jgi:hypothetical protein